LKRNKKLKNAGNWAFFSGMAFEMAAIIGFGVWLGNKMDKRTGKAPLFIVLFSLLSVLTAIYHSIRNILKWQNRSN
jgi:F0F1-type ATP synthase assembly protein I